MEKKNNNLSQYDICIFRDTYKKLQWAQKEL